MDKYKDKEQDDEQPTLGFIKTGLHVNRLEQARTDAEVDTKISDLFDKICGGAKDNYNKHGSHPATVIGLGPTCDFQLDLNGMGSTPDPTACAFAVLQHLASSKGSLNPQGYIFVVEAVKCESPNDLTVLSDELYITVTSRNGDHRVCSMAITVDGDTRRIDTQGETRYIYQKESPFSEIWKVWNEDEDFGAEINMSGDMDLGGLIGGK
jgi:hypothetical protein